MKELKQPTVLSFVLGVIFVIIAALLYGRSEYNPDGAAGSRQEIAAIAFFVAGVIGMALSFVLYPKK